MIMTRHPSTVAHGDGAELGFVASDVDTGAPGRSQTIENTRSSLSNTAPKLPNCPTSKSTAPVTVDWGVDTVKVGFAVTVDQCSPSSESKQYTTSRTGRDGAEDDRVTWSLDLEHAEVRVDLFIHRAICHLQFNPSRLIHGKSKALWSPDSLTELVRLVLEAVHGNAWPEFVRWSDAGEIVWDGDWADRVKVRRLDVARNLFVSDPALVKRVLPSVVPRYFGHTNVYRDSEGGWTLVNGTKSSGQDRLYDKAAELAAKGVENTLVQSAERLFRFETQLQKDRLARYGLERLSDVTSATAWNALNARWEATGWGTPLPSSSGLLEAITGLTPVVTERLIGFLHLEAIGESGRILTPTHTRTYRALARKLGLTPGLPVEFLGKADRFLSLERGVLQNLDSI